MRLDEGSIHNVLWVEVLDSQINTNVFQVLPLWSRRFLSFTSKWQKAFLTVASLVRKDAHDKVLDANVNNVTKLLSEMMRRDWSIVKTFQSTMIRSSFPIRAQKNRLRQEDRIILFHLLLAGPGKGSIHSHRCNSETNGLNPHSLEVFLSEKINWAPSSVWLAVIARSIQAVSSKTCITFLTGNCGLWVPLVKWNKEKQRNSATPRRWKVLLWHEYKTSHLQLSTFIATTRDPWRHCKFFFSLFITCWRKKSWTQFEPLFCVQDKSCLQFINWWCPRKCLRRKLNCWPSESIQSFILASPNCFVERIERDWPERCSVSDEFNDSRSVTV